MAACLLAVGCIHSGEAELRQDPLTRWASSALDDDAKVLFRQGYAEVNIADKWEKRALGTGFDASHDACEGFDASVIPNELGKLHAQLHVARSDISEQPGSSWVEVTTPMDALQVALLDRIVGTEAKVVPPADLPLEVGMKFKSSATNLSIARVVKRLDLSTQARKCIEATLCRPMSDDKVPDTVRYVERVYYGNLIRLRFGEQVFKLATKGTIEGATAKFSVRAKQVHLDLAMLGRIDPTGAFDIPQMLEMLANRRAFEIQHEIAWRSVNHEIVGYRFAEVNCLD